MSSVSAVAGDAHDAVATVAFVDADAVAVAPLVAVATDVAVAAFCAVAVTPPQAARRPTIKARRRARIGSMIRLLSKSALWAG